jgi:hypothetical protein
MGKCIDCHGIFEFNQILSPTQGYTMLKKNSGTLFLIKGLILTTVRALGKYTVTYEISQLH